MPLQDYSLPIGSRLVMGADELDLLPALASFSLSQPIAELSNPLIWSAKLTLEDTIGFPESFDKVSNYARWQRGKHPIRLFLYNTLICTLRLKTYHYDSVTGLAEISATDILGLLDFDRTKSASPDFKTKALLQQDGVQLYPFMPRALALSGVLINGSIISGVQYLRQSQIITNNLPAYLPNGRQDGFTVDQGTGKTNPIQHAQEIVGALGYWLYCDPQENIRCAKYPTDTIAPVRRYALSEVEEFKPKEPDFDESPPSTVTAVGTQIISCKVLNKNDPEEKKLIPPGFGVTYPIVSEAKGDGGIVVQRTTRDGSADDPDSRITVEKSLASLMPDDHPDDNTLVTANDQTIASDYNEQGYLVQRLTIDLQPLGVIAKDSFPGSTALAATITTERWTYADGVPLEKSIITTQPGFAVFSDEAAGGAQTFYEGEIETWTPIGTRKYEHLLVKTKPKGTLATAINPYDATPTIVNPVAPDFVDAPPEAPRKPAPAPVVAKPEKAEAKVAPNGETEGYAGNGSIIRFSCCFGLDNARAIAQLQANLEWQRHAAYNVTRPFDPRCDLGFVPFQREDVHNRSLIRDGYTIAIGSDGLSVAYTGNLIGTIAPIPDPYEAPAIVPDLTTPTPPLTIAAVPSLSFAVGVPISSFSLVAAGGAN